MKYTVTIVSLLLSISLSAQDSFTNLNGIPGGRVKSIHFDQSGQIYVAEDFQQKIYRAAANDTIWTAIGPTSALVYDFLIDGTDFYYSDYSNLHKSTNGGASWTKVNGSSGFKNTTRLFKVGASTFMTYGGCEGVYVSSDNGVSWVNITGNSSCNNNSYQAAYSSTGDVYYVDPSLGIRKHPFPTDGVWSPSKVTTVFAKETTGADYELSVFVNRLAANKVFITHSSTTGQTVIKTSATGNNGSFTALASPSGANFNAANWSVAPNAVVYLFAGGLGFYELTNEATPTWTSKAVPNGAYSDYNVLNIAWKSNAEAYAGIEGSGVFKTTNTASSWSYFNGGGTGKILSPWGSDIEILGDGTIVVKEDNGTKGVWTSSNQGASFIWRPQSFVLYGGRSQQKISKLQDNSLISASHDGTRRSTNGITWTKQNNNTYVMYLPVGANEIVAVGDNNTPGSPIGRSTDLGVTWTNQAVTGLPSNWYPMYVTTVGGNYFIALNNNNNNQTEYWKLDTAPATWLATKLVTPLSTNGFNCFGFFELNGKLYAGDREKIAISPDQGVNWTTVQYAHEYVMPIRQGAGGIGLGTRGSLIITQDDGINWRSITLPNAQAFVKDIAKDAGNNFYAVCQGGPVAKFTGNLILGPSELPTSINFSWQPLSGPTGGQTKRVLKTTTNQIFALGPEVLHKNNTATASWDRVVATNRYYDARDAIIDNADKIYLLNSYQLLTSSNGGVAWTTKSGNLSDALKIVKANNGNLIVSSNDGLYLSTNDGTSFSKPASLSSGSVTAIAVLTTGNVFASRLVGGTASLLKSADHGATWSAVSGVDLSGGKEVLSISALESGAVGVVTTDNIYKSTDGGTTWSSIKGNLAATYNVNDSFWRYAAKLYVSPTNEYFMSNQLALYKSTDNGTTWTKLSDTPIAFLDVAFVSGKLYAGTLIDGVYESSDGGTTFAKYFDNKGLFNFVPNNLEIQNGKLHVAVGFGSVFTANNDAGSFAKASSNYADYLAKVGGNVISIGGGINQTIDGTTWTDLQVDGGFYYRFAAPDGVNYYAVRDLNGTQQFVKSTNLINWTPLTVTGLPATVGFETLAADLAGNIYFTGYNSATGTQELYRIAFGAATRIDEVTRAMSVQFANDKLYAYSQTGNIFESADGLVWSRRSAPQDGNKLLITSNSYFFISNELTGALWLSRDQGKSWQNVGGYVGDSFQSVRLDFATGFAYAIAENRPVLKSSAIILPNDNTAPIASFLPANSASGVAKNFTLSVTFNEAVKKVAGKTVRLFDLNNPTNPVQVWDATVGVFSNDNKTITFTPTASIGYLTQYFVVIDNGAFTDIFGNAYTGIAVNDVWRFTIEDSPDLANPEIQFTTTNRTINKGETKELAVTVTDDKNVPANTTFIYYRKIGAAASSSFTEQAMTYVTGASDLSMNFTVQVQASWPDDMGLEYYFETTDGAGKEFVLRGDGDKPFYSYVNFGNESGKPKVSGIGFGASETSYKIISIPHNLEDGQILTQFSELGPAGKGNWRVLSYNGTDKYDEFPDQLKTFGRGVGYWTLARDAKDVFLEGASSPNHNRDDLFSMNLRQGWNLIGNPYTVAIDWGHTKSTNAALGDLKKYQNGVYVNSNQLAPFEGGWVFATQAVNGLKVQLSAASSGGRVAQIGSNLAEADWEVPLIIRQGDRGSEVAGIGMRTDASKEVDHFDDFNPPSLSTTVEIRFTGTSQSVAKDVVSSQPSYVWEFVAVTESTGSAVIEWNPSAFGDNAKELFLFDLKLQQKINMRMQNSYVFSGDQSRSFKIYYGENAEKEIKPTLTLLNDPYPNPSSGQLFVPFTIDESGGAVSVRADVFDSHGRKVATLVEGTGKPGFNTVRWDFAQQAVQPGVYLVKWISRSEQGEVTNQTKKIVIH